MLFETPGRHTHNPTPTTPPPELPKGAQRPLRHLVELLMLRGQRRPRSNNPETRVHKNKE
jgi:hypothetical protein